MNRYVVYARFYVEADDEFVAADKAWTVVQDLDNATIESIYDIED